MAVEDDIKIIQDFLRVTTPKEWLHAANEQIPLILVDHAHCERKAASMAILLMSKYPDQEAVNAFLSPLIREELLHFDKVLNLLRQRNIRFGPLKASAYAQKLHHQASNQDHLERLSDLLIIGALIEARSCERFAALAPMLKDAELAKFYFSLVKAEARHFKDYLKLAQLYHPHTFSKRLMQFLEIENAAILAKDSKLRFHSGIPC